MNDQPQPTPEQGLRQIEQEMFDILATFDAAVKALAISGVVINNTPGALDIPTCTVTVMMNKDADGKIKAKRFQGKDLFSALRDAGMVLHNQILDWSQTTDDFREYFASRERIKALRAPKPLIHLPTRN